MSTRSESLATAVDQSNKALLAAVEASTPEQWAERCTDGESTQGFAAYHAAASLGGVTEIVRDVAGGQPFPKMTMGELDAQNAQQAKEHAGCTSTETVELIKRATPAAVGMVRSLSDDQLDRKLQLLDGMPEVNIETLIQLALVGHATYHLQTITGAR